MNTFKFLIAGVLLAFGTAASAATIDPLQLDFADGSGSGGTMTEVSPGDIHGVDIFIGSLTVRGTGTLEGEYVVDAMLNFDTSADTLTIYGTAGDLGITTQQNLFSGNISSFDWTDGPFTDIFFAEGSGGASAELLAAVGGSAGAFTYVGFSLESFDGEVISTDFLATQTTRSVPEVPVPAAVWLFGSGLLGLVGVARRKTV